MSPHSVLSTSKFGLTARTSMCSLPSGDNASGAQLACKPVPRQPTGSAEHQKAAARVGAAADDR